MARLVAVRASSRAGRPVVAHFRKQGSTYERAFERSSAPPWMQSQVLRRTGRDIRSISWGPNVTGPGSHTIVQTGRFTQAMRPNVSARTVSPSSSAFSRRLYMSPTKSSLGRLAKLYRGVR